MKKIRNVMTLLLAALALLFTGSQVFADTTGSITVQNASKGQTYTIYKLFDATVGDNGAIAYTLPDGKTAADVASYFDVDSAGNVTAKSTTTQAVVGSAEFTTWAKGFGTKVESPVQATGNTVTFSGLSFGYYFVESSLGATITVDSTNPNATVNDKNTTAPSIPDSDGGKKIVEGSNKVSTTTAKIGDTVNYQIKFTATNYVTSSATDSKLITEYTVTDTPSNLNINKDTVAVTIAGTSVDSGSVTVTKEGNNLKVILPWVDSNNNSLYNAPSEVVITYTATVTSGAASTTAQTGSATNTAAISYKTSDDPTTPVSVGSDSSTTVNTYGLTINKTDGTKALTGAEFKLYDASTGGNEIKVVKVSNGHYRVAESGETGVAIEAGTATISGLKGGTTYYLEETKAPNGYNKLTSRKEVTVASQDNNSLEVVNNAGAELPSTGSFGTKMLYVVGASAILVAFVYMIAKRRVKNL